MSSIQISLNGETMLTKSETLNALLSELELADKKVAVELNRVIVSRVDYAETRLSTGDQLEIIHFVGGG